MKYWIILLLLVGFATFNTFSNAYAGVPVEKVPITSFEAHSIDGKQIDKVMMGQQVTFVSNVENTQDTNQSFVYGVWIENQKGERVFEDWIDATLEPKSSFSPSILWSPTETGNFTAEASVWKSNDNPTAFSAVWSVVLEVSMMDNDATFDYVYPLKQFKSGIEIEEIQCRDSLILVIKYDGSPACIKSESHKKLYERGWTKLVPIQPEIGKMGTLDFQANNENFKIKYDIKGGALDKIFYDEPANSVIFQLNQPYNGELTVELPRTLMEIIQKDYDGDYFVLLDGVQTDFGFEDTSFGKKISIKIPQRTYEMELIGSF